MSSKVVLLGTGSPACFPNTYQNSSAVVVDNVPYLVDCGGGVVQRLSLLRESMPETFAFPNIQIVFLTHLHPDHTVGLPDLLIAPWVRGRKEPLVVYGPAGTRKMVTLLVEAYELGIAEHADNVTPTDWPLLWEVVEYTEGVIHKDSQVEVEAFEVSHGGLETYGLKFTTSDKTIVFSADTKPHPNILKHGTGADILVHEAYSEVGLNSNPRYPDSYFRRMHTSTVELAEIANRTRPGQIVLTHIMQLGPISDEDFVAEITETYDGVVHFGHDLDVFE